MSLSALFLGAFAVLGVSVVAITHETTRQRIEDNERAALLRSLNAVLPGDAHDNALHTDVFYVRDPEWLGTEAPVPIYRGRRNGRGVAAVLAPVAPDGYSGSIRLLVGVDRQGQLSGVRVLGHRETPGLGDAIEVERSDWILGFTGRSLADPGEAGWAVKRDGGEFDQFTGATITPRAVVKAVHRSLQFFTRHRARIFEAEAGQTVDMRDGDWNSDA